MLTRTRRTIEALVADYPTNILVVGHGATVTGLAHGLLDSTPKIDAALCGLVKLSRKEESWHLELNNDTSHLSKNQSSGQGVWV
jgi:broad specificity phosphatase PhoE